MTWGQAVFALICLWAGASYAAEPERCRTVRMSDPGWSDIAATNGVAGALPSALGYRQHVDLLAVNLDDGKFTLAVPDYVAAAGVRDFRDLARFDDRFGRHIYGIGAGAPANESILRMLDAKDYGLGDWELIESSEQGMLAQLDRMQRRRQWIVFLAWEPHPMNVKFPIVYLSGGERYFGPDFGRTTINTVARRHYAEDCPNAARLFRQLRFRAAQEDELMQDIERRKEDPPTVAPNFLARHRDRLAGWLDGVTTWDGGDGLAAVERAVGPE